MAVADIPILSLLRTRLDWAEARQRVLAENVANSDTPKFRPHDLAPLKLDDPPLAMPGSEAHVPPHVSTRKSLRQ